MQMELFAKLFDGGPFYKLGNIDPDIMKSVRYPETPVKIRTTDPVAINEFLHFAELHKTSNDLSLMLLNFVQESLKTLIEDLKKEYPLK
jgi:hypothetical protein